MSLSAEGPEKATSFSFLAMLFEISGQKTYSKTINHLGTWIWKNGQGRDRYSAFSHGYPLTQKPSATACLTQQNFDHDCRPCCIHIPTENSFRTAEFQANFRCFTISLSTNHASLAPPQLDSPSYTNA